MRALFTTYEGGGHVPPSLIVSRVLRARGHDTLLISDEATRAAAGALPFESWRRAPNRTRAADAGDPLEDWRARTPLGVVKAVTRAVMCGPALDYARDVLETLERFDADVIVSQELLFGAMLAAEKADKPLALLTGNLWCFPTREDVPPFGPGFPPARSRWQDGRERTTRRLLQRLYDVGLGDLNRARAALGLRPLRHVLDQLETARLVLLGTSGAFDYGRTDPPAPFAYAGPLFEVPAWSTADIPAALSDDRYARVLVSFSTTFQDQAAAIDRCIAALADLPMVRAVVTLGPALTPEQVARAPNVTVVQSASHDALMPHIDVVVCHGGHGTLLRPLMHGVPVVCLPMGRDQPENAARVVHAGAGVRLSPRASARSIRAAVTRVFDDEGIADAAATLGARIAAEADGGERAASLVEALAGR